MLKAILFVPNIFVVKGPSLCMRASDCQNGNKFLALFLIKCIKGNIIFQTSQQFASILNSQVRSVDAVVLYLSVYLQFSVDIRLCACTKSCGKKE